MTAPRAPASVAHAQGSKTHARRSEPKPPITIIDACTDPAIFGNWFKDRETWAAWFAFLKVVFGLTLAGEELEIFKACTGRTNPSPAGYLDIALVIGRRGGKSLVCALIAAFQACFIDWRPFLIEGERACIVVVAADRRQAAVALKYIRAFLDIPLLAGLIERETLDTIELSNGVDIQIQTANYKSIRGRTVVAAIADELAFWSDENSQNPDVEVIGALRPTMATIPSGLLMKASSPYARRGALWSDYRKHFGKDESRTLVWQADTRTMNPAVPESFIAQAYEDDAAAASAEYGAQFRGDIESFVSREAVDACVVQGRFELPPLANVKHVAFCDPSGGSADSMTLAIGHKEGDRAVLDVIREARPPFSPESVVAEFAALLKQYRVHTIYGDKYAGQWPRERFQTHNITYEASARPKSELYASFLPLVNGRRAELLDHPKLVSQLCALERRTSRGGRDSIDHPPGHHDDVVNSVAGVLTNLIAPKPPMPVFGAYGSDGMRIVRGQPEWHHEMQNYFSQLRNEGWS